MKYSKFYDIIVLILKLPKARSDVSSSVDLTNEIIIGKAPA
jgi:hypothetical protein